MDEKVESYKLEGSGHHEKIALVIATTFIGLFTLSGCELLNQNNMSKQDKVSVDAVSKHFSAMDKYEIDNTSGKVTISAKEPGTLYVLATRSNLDKVKAENCTVDGKAMSSSSSSLNYPDNQGTNYFAFAEMQITHSGDYELTSAQSNVDKILVLFDLTA